MSKRKKIIAMMIGSTVLVSNLPLHSYANEINSNNIIEKNNSTESSNELIDEGVSINGGEILDLSNIESDEIKSEIDDLQKLLNLYQQNSSEIKYDVNKDLTNEDIQVRYDEIESKYNVGDTLTPEDSEFIIRFDRSGLVNMNDLIKQTRSQITRLSSRGSHNFSSTTGPKSFSNEKLQVGLTMKFSGTVTWHNGKNNSGGNANQHRISIKSTNSCYSKHVSTRTPVLYVKAYGLASGDLLKLEHSETLTGIKKSGTGEQGFSDSTGNYTVGIHAKTVVTPRVNFTTKAGSSTYIDGFK